jgi:hypothetical protein
MKKFLFNRETEKMLVVNAKSSLVKEIVESVIKIQFDIVLTPLLIGRLHLKEMCPKTELDNIPDKYPFVYH